jgi:hypothetical protein
MPDTITNRPDMKPEEFGTFKERNLNINNL